jgi:hypothetical protein
MVCGFRGLFCVVLLFRCEKLQNSIKRSIFVPATKGITLKRDRPGALGRFRKTRKLHFLVRQTADRNSNKFDFISSIFRSNFVGFAHLLSLMGD